MWIIFILISIFFTNQTFSANILFIGGVPSPSHHLWNRVLALGLVEKGHNLTLISPDKETIVGLKNYSTILLEDIYKEMNDDINIVEVANFNPFKIWFWANDFIKSVCKLQLSTRGLQQLLDYPKDFKFDLILYDVTLDWCLAPLITRFNSPPIIGVTAYLLPSYLSFNYGNSLFPSYLPAYNLPYSNEMSFIQRLTNLIYTRLDVFLQYQIRYPQIEAIIKEKFGNNIPSWQELNRNVMLLLANTDPLLDYPQPLPPNIIPIGGLHTQNKNKIPDDLLKILDNADNGVIILSLGTNIRSDKLSDNVKMAILETFSRLKELVIWKFESQLENLPKNVIIRKWLPQNDILGHRNIKLFIGHGGALSTQEAIYHGVPMIAVPFMLDQYVNAKKIQQMQLGLMINVNDITTNYLYNKIKEVLDNPIYRENVKKISKRFRDRPQTPLEKAVFWIEHVLKHGGDDFLSPKSRDMPYYQSAEIDILLFIIVVISLFSFVIVKASKSVFRLFVRNQKIKIN